MNWHARVEQIGLRGAAADLAARRFAEVELRYNELIGNAADACAWWVPGRIEVLGKHTDYGGGRSLLCAVERGFHVMAAPRADGVVHLVDASTAASLTLPLAASVASRPGSWTDYPISVIRRIARDFPSATTGMNAVIRSSLPSAAGMSSSSAMVIATFLPLCEFNALAETAEWRAAIRDRDALAEYLGAVENGRAYGPFATDCGVGTEGGAEDQTAILQSAPGQLVQYHFIPVTREAAITVPPGWQFVLAVSGVHAAKGGAVQARYNTLAREIASLLSLWQQQAGGGDRSLFAALQRGPGVADSIAAAVRARHGDEAGDLLARLAQFRDETEVIIPAVAAHLATGDVAAIGPLVERSQRLAESALRNQISETVHLVQQATAFGAAAASAFGAGFGGSVWALVPMDAVPEFTTRWRADYLHRFPQHRARADFFASHAAPAACRLAAIS